VRPADKPFQREDISISLVLVRAAWRHHWIITHHVGRAVVVCYEASGIRSESSTIWKYESGKEEGGKIRRQVSQE